MRDFIRYQLLYAFPKRIIDIIAALIGLIICSPLFIVLAIAIKLDSKGPVIFSHERVGKGGKNFKIYKFRSMVENAEEILKVSPQLLQVYESNSYKIKHDPRSTRVGRLIRRFSLDEFPQFWNILTGDMSLVGPRAYRPIELIKQQEVYPETKQYVNDLLTTKPGATGPWQVGGRSKINFDQRVKMDAEYAKKRSLVYDLGIIVRTPSAVIIGDGAS